MSPVGRRYSSSKSEQVSHLSPHTSPHLDELVQHWVGELEGGELHSGEMAEYQVDNPTETARVEQPTENFNAVVVSFIAFRFRSLGKVLSD